MKKNLSLEIIKDERKKSRIDKISSLIKKIPRKIMSIQESRVWALQELLKKEGKLYTQMYDCAQIYAETWGDLQDVEKLYKSWECYNHRIPNNRL